jgi:hypothetical protein
VSVVRIEALWALKLQAGRDSDLTDLFVISDQPSDLRQVVQVFTELSTPSLTAKLSRVRARLGDRRLYEDSLSRRQFGRPRDPHDVARWQRFVSLVDTVVRPLTGGLPAL